MSAPQKDPEGQKSSEPPQTSNAPETPSKAPEATTAGQSQDLSKMDLDTILINEIGELGRYQARIFFFVFVMTIFSAWAAVEWVFTTARIPTRCFIPECEKRPAVFSPPWLMNAIPPSAKSGFDYCYRYAPASGRRADDNCPASMFDRQKRLPCQSYVFENTHSVVYEFGLECKEWMRTVIGTTRTFGAMLALPLTGWMSDRYGRRITVTFYAFNTAWLGLVRFWADSYYGFLISEFVESLLGSGGYSSIYILALELLGPKYRVAAGATVNTSFAIGQVSLGLIAWKVSNWRWLTLTLYAPMLITFFYYWLLGESVRWLMSKGRFDEAEALLRKVSRINKTSVSDASLAALRSNTQEKLRISALNAQQVGGNPSLITQVYRHKRVLLRVIVSPVWWFTAVFTYYGLTINSINMIGNRYFNYMAVAVVEIPGFWCAFYLMNRIGRKKVLTGGFCMCAACQITYIFLRRVVSGASLAVYLIAKCSIAMVMTSVYVYTAELYPTNNRHKLFAFCSMCGRVGAMLAPLTPAFSLEVFAEMPYVLFAVLSLLSGALIFLTPETLGTVMPDTFEQAEALGLKK